MGKVDLRRSLIQKRQSMSVGVWRESSDRICTQLQNSLLFTQAKTVLAYFSFRQEPDLSPLFTDPNYNWGFPRCVGKSLDWHLWTPEDSVQVGAYGITEPPPHAPMIEPAAVDLILVPCVACDYQGFRLGYGGGYYDRLLSSPNWANKPTIGIVFDFAYLPQIPLESWDQPLQVVITENH
ncbi:MULTISPECIES: 5-formyltetrahydrofolate cyclo-ligase [unclassified Nodularia (in: cyanobacteria)]|uniref:5-formyltetrahydrofolate cyclo-ligase n=1 Tax=unclassified Nodularia (in: cyanobacteria) TaxID=2656917 RepID=UPI001880EA41|nr:MULTISPECIES: 5-formyltetrahydrofolate cyclo-ligase [unclassified Nodularia (in: cyanobacteria)]MBE9197839.1 5-formyltetrahydrofolate cyclo-ligase [Nodularia sp. LEGE 06071]MCC2695512.1 5-formyltetrahydrofolate cyclo-ligase [Nodularia sp. LEGE 04288]